MRYGMNLKNSSLIINRLKAQFDELNLDYSRDIAGKKGEAAAKVFNDYKHRFQ